MAVDDARMKDCENLKVSKVGGRKVAQCRHLRQCMRGVNTATGSFGEQEEEGGEQQSCDDGADEGRTRSRWEVASQTRNVMTSIVQ